MKTLLTRLLFIAFFAATCLSAYSQSNYYPTESGDKSSSVYSAVQPTETKSQNAYKTTWKKNRFKDTWYITIGSGAQILLAEDDDKGSFKSRITYAPTFTIGKQFSPIWGLKLNFTGGSLHGYNDGADGTYSKWNSGSKNYQGKGYAGTPGYPGITEIGAGFLTWDPQWVSKGFTQENGQILKSGDNYYWAPGNQGQGPNVQVYMQHVRYAAANLNFTFNLLTLIGDYNPKRLVDIVPYGGVSYVHVFPHIGYEAFDGIGANGGLDVKFRLSDKFDVNVGGSLAVYPDNFDGHAGGVRSMDLVAQTTAGITYKIGKSTWDVCDPMNYDKIQDLNNKINDLRNQVRDLNVPCPDCPKSPTVIPVETTKEIAFLPDPVFFRIDKSVIDAGQWDRIEKAVDYLRSYPGASVVVTGYADKQTGYPAYNTRLSERRAKTVSKVLIDKYGINPLRVSINWEGDRIQPFEINEWNRVVVFVIE